jgi:hypothetical protein
LRQIELNVPTRLPCGSLTGPLLSASVPDSSTSTVSGSHENGASGRSKNGFHAAATAALPRIAPCGPKNTVSSDRNDTNAVWFRSAIVFANARSVSRT